MNGQDLIRRSEGPLARRRIAEEKKRHPAIRIEGFMMTRTEVLANWYLPPAPVMENLGIVATLERDTDWQVLRHFEFGDLGWDPEEGLRLECDISKIADLVNFVREYHLRWRVPFVRGATPTHRGYARLSCSLCTIGEEETFAKTFEAAGLTRCRWDRRTWELRGYPEDPDWMTGRIYDSRPPGHVKKSNSKERAKRIAKKKPRPPAKPGSENDNDDIPF